MQTIQPVDAVLPRNADGGLNFTSASNPTTGRTPNQGNLPCLFVIDKLTIFFFLRIEGFEGLTFDVDTHTLYVMLQSATIQDGGISKTTSRYTRLFAYDVGSPITKPELVGEWVVPLPRSSKGNTQACSEIHFVSPGIFLALSRDGDGRGGSGTKSGYKCVSVLFSVERLLIVKPAPRQADLFSIASATDIHGSKFDSPANPIAVGGVLDSSITPANYVSFVNYLDSTQLARFGLHNGMGFALPSCRLPS